DHAVGAAGRDDEAFGHFVDGHVVHAVDADFAVAVHALHNGAGHHFQRVPVDLLVDRVAVRQRLGQVLGNVQEEVASLRHVKELHADADSHHGNTALGHQ